MVALTREIDQPRIVPTIRARSLTRPVLTAYLLLAPSGAFLLVFTYWPVIQVIRGSLIVKSFRNPAHWGFDNYARLFSDPHFGNAVINNLIYAAGTIVPSLVLALLFALALRETTRLSSALRTLIALPMLIPLVAPTLMFVGVIATLNALTQVDHIIVLT